MLFLGFVLLPVVLAAVYSFYNLRTRSVGDPLRALHRLRQLRAGADRPGVPDARRQQLPHHRAVPAHPGPDRDPRRAADEPQLRGRGALRPLIFVPYVLAEVIAGLSWKLLPAAPRRRDAMLEAIGIGEPGATGWPTRTSRCGRCSHPDLEVHRLRDHPHARRPAGRARRARRGGARSTAPAGGRPSGTSPSRCSARPSASGCSCRSSAPCSSSTWSGSPDAGGPLNASSTMATYMVENGQFVGQPGFGSAVAVILFFISLFIALVYQRFALRRDLAGASRRDTRSAVTIAAPARTRQEPVPEREPVRPHRLGSAVRLPGRARRRGRRDRPRDLRVHRRVPHHPRLQRESRRLPDPWTVENYDRAGPPRFWATCSRA